MGTNDDWVFSDGSLALSRTFSWVVCFAVVCSTHFLGVTLRLGQVQKTDGSANDSCHGDARELRPMEKPWSPPSASEDASFLSLSEFFRFRVPEDVHGNLPCGCPFELGLTSHRFPPHLMR